MSSLIQIEGIVLKTNKYGETSIISQTDPWPWVAVFYHGRSQWYYGKAGMFQIMNQLDIVTYFNEHKSIHRIKEARYAKIYQTLPFEMQRTAVGESCWSYWGNVSRTVILTRRCMIGWWPAGRHWSFANESHLDSSILFIGSDQVFGIVAEASCARW